MPWKHEDGNKPEKFICERKGETAEIELSGEHRECNQCWRLCTFHIRGNGVEHRFTLSNACEENELECSICGERLEGVEEKDTGICQECWEY